VLGVLFGASVVPSRRIGLATLGLAVIVAAARVYVSVHYPWDVIAGFGFGAAFGALAFVVCRRALPLLFWFDRWLQRAHLRPLLIGRAANRSPATPGSGGVQP
jgi:membrane-associated phospholipid phosphatase